jgi:DNA repair exonuclease SbcCD ATPase subunit
MNKNIIIKRLIIRNFKGIKSLSIDFAPAQTTISGENGKGKTTIQDAFLWLLFGKDSTGRSDSNFNIKTLDDSGKPILKLEHEVTGVFSVNGNEITLRRVYLEKWEKPRGTTQEVLKNHYTEYYINNVKQPTKMAYEMEVSEIIPEDVFRMITNPYYFPTRPAAEQKAMLLEMVGNISDREVAELKPEYLELLSQLSGNTLETFKKEIAAKKRAIKEELDQIPARIDTANQLMPASEKWDELESLLSAKRAKVSEIENQIVDKSKLVEAEYKRKSGIQTEIGEKRLERTKRENAIRTQSTADSNTAQTAIRNLGYDIEKIDGAITNKKSQISTIEETIKGIDSFLEISRGQYRTINAEQLKYPEGAFECPTCHRPLDADDIETKQAELQSNFNQNKSRRLADNQATGLKKANEKKELQKQRENLLAEIADLENQKITLNGQKSYQEEHLPKDVQSPESIILADPDWIRLGNEIADLENQLNVDAKPVDTSELQASKTALNNEISELNKRLANRENITRAERLIAELEEKRSVGNQALADLERMEFIALDFQKAKDNELMNRINGMFSLISFSFIDEQLNGGEKTTCVCTVNGTPYPDVNNAGRINAGLDIINAICRIKGITAPIFVDNAESINQLLPVASQLIKLVVTSDKELTTSQF